MHNSNLLRIGSVALIVAVAATVLPAQGPGTTTFGPFNTEASTLGLSNLGVQYMSSTNTIIVTGRGNTPLGGAYVGTPPHTMYQLDMSGNVLQQWPQRLQTNTALLWGHRDPASDGSLLFVGDEEGIFCFNPATGLYETNPIVSTSFGGLSYTFPLPVPVGTGTPIATARALAYNPAGNGGLGSLWVGDFGADLVEIDLNGAILTTHPANGTWSLYGLAWDPIRQVLWGSTSPNGGNLVEIDPITGLETGVSYPRFSAGAQGGMSWMQRAGVTGAHSELLVLVQGASIPGAAGLVDAIAGQRIDLYNPLGNGGAGHREEAIFQSDVNGGGFNTATKFFKDGDALSWGFTPAPLSSGLLPFPTVIMLSIGADALVNANTLGIPEFVAPNSFSVPAATLGLTYEIGGPLGGLLALPVPLGPNTLADPATVFPSWPAGLLSLGDTMRMQAYVLDGGTTYGSGAFPGYATNTLNFTYLSPSCFLEDFETVPIGAGNYPAGWVNGPGGTATDQWQPRTGATPSAGTGASAANAGAVYMYCEASGAANTWPKTFVMDSPPIPVCGGGILTFATHLWGTTVGTLVVEDLDAMGAPISQLITITGDQGNQWVTNVVPGIVPDLSGNVTLRFTYTTPAANNSWVGDACIDSIAIR